MGDTEKTLLLIVFGVLFMYSLVMIPRWLAKKEKHGNTVRNLSLDKMKDSPPQKKTDDGKDVETFNQKFVQANLALTKGNSEGLKEGLSLFIESLPYSGTFESRVVSTIKSLHGALSRHTRADQKGPWNRDLSGYGVISWKNDLYDRDTALRMAWEDISSINEELKRKGLGWDY